MTRGLLIGEIIDNLSNLSNQVIIRCSLGLTDLNTVCEEFFRRLLNHIYAYNLVNLNSKKSTVPGIDLGDQIYSIAFQITSQADSAKINSTLQKITPEQKSKYKIIKILIIGNKQGSYTAIEPTLIQQFQYRQPGKIDPEEFTSYNIVDIKDLLRDIILLDFKNIDSIYRFIKEEIQSVAIELEIPRPDGSYPTSILKRIEVIPETRARNAQLILPNSKYPNISLTDINEFFDQLSSIPRVTREIYYFIVKNGTFEDDTFSIYFDEAIRILNIPEKRLSQEANILSRKKLIYELDEEEVKLTLWLKKDETGYMLLELKEKYDLYGIIVSLDFTNIDKKQ